MVKLTRIKVAALFAGLAGAGMICAVPLAAPIAATTPTPPQPPISDEASAAVELMGKSLRADHFSFKVWTLRVYYNRNGQPLHIQHAMKVVVRRPDRLLAVVTGDDGSTKLLYDGTRAVLFSAETNKYAIVPVPNTLQGMLEKLMGKLGVDFPLADFLTDAPDKSFLFGVTSGEEVGTSIVDGVPCHHLLFLQSGGIELELWVEMNERALPRRLIVTYRALPDQPSFIAEFSDWDFAVKPADSVFVFTAPAGATQIDLRAAAPAEQPKEAK